MVFVFLCLTSLSMTRCRSIHVIGKGIISSFLGRVIFYCVYAPRFSIHSSVDGHLGRFHIMASVNSAAVNMGERVSFQLSVSSG